jgi:hypothetical protein
MTRPQSVGSAGRRGAPGRLPGARMLAAPLLLAAMLGAGSDAPVDRMLRPILKAPSVTARVLLYQSDPFGGPPEESSGRAWYQPGRGLRVRLERGGGEEVLADRSKGGFFLYRVREGTVYHAPWERTPARLRRLVEEPDRILASDLRARAERRRMLGSDREGFRVRDASLGDSTTRVSLWIAPDPKSGLLRWITLAADEDTIWIELKGLALKKSASEADLRLSAPRDAKMEPLDPRELLPRGESR